MMFLKSRTWRIKTARTRTISPLSGERKPLEPPDAMELESSSMATNLRGILAPALTAVTDDFQINQERTIAHYKWLLENGCDGLVVFGTTSEANSFSVTERKRLLEQAVGAGIKPENYWLEPVVPPPTIN